MRTGVDALDRSVQETNVWLDEVQERLGLASRQQAYRALCATLHAVRDRIDPAHAAHLGALLPVMIRGIYFDGAEEQGRSKESVLQRVDGIMNCALGLETEDAVRAVLDVVAAHLPARDRRQLERTFPPELRELWPGSFVAEAS